MERIAVPARTLVPLGLVVRTTGCLIAILLLKVLKASKLECTNSELFNDNDDYDDDDVATGAVMNFACSAVNPPTTRLRTALAI